MWSSGQKGSKEDIVGKGSGGRESGKDLYHPLDYCFQTVARSSNFLSGPLKTWDLKCSPVIIGKTELSACLGMSSSGTAGKPNPQHHPLLSVPSRSE